MVIEIEINVLSPTPGKSLKRKHIKQWEKKISEEWSLMEQLMKLC